VKELARFEGQIDELVPAPVAALLGERVARARNDAD
jgi:pantetheine-phosphate adenylyltransferase